MRTRSVFPISSLNKLTGMNVPRGFMSSQQRITKILSTILIASLWITPELMHAAVQEQKPNAAQPAPTATTTTTQPAPEKKQQEKQPVGAATAESVPTSGGAAAKPAGVAIAPAKQHQTRSLLIKIGAFAAAGVAAGTVYALSRGTSSTPPNTNNPGATPK